MQNYSATENQSCELWWNGQAFGECFYVLGLPRGEHVQGNKAAAEDTFLGIFKNPQEAQKEIDSGKFDYLFN